MDFQQQEQLSPLNRSCENQTDRRTLTNIELLNIKYYKSEICAKIDVKKIKVHQALNGRIDFYIVPNSFRNHIAKF